MLQKLFIRNYAIIDRLVLEPDDQLNTVTGETGAGKSIILGALSLILGERADTSVLINKSEKSVIEGHFDVKNHPEFRAAALDAGLDDGEECIIRREIAPTGKSRAFINDTPVTLQVLHMLASLLVDLHQQFDHVALDEGDFQVASTDAICGTLAEHATYKSKYSAYKKLTRSLSELRTQRDSWQKEADYKRYLLSELQEAAFKDGEIEDAAQQLRRMSHSERIIQSLNWAITFFAEGEQPILPEIRRIAQQLQGLTELVPSLAPIQQRLLSSYEELKDISSELKHEHDLINLDPEVMQALQERVDLGYRLLKKHALTDSGALLQLQSTLEEALESSANIDDAITDLELQVDFANKELMAFGETLSKKRTTALPSFIAKMNQLLAMVGMPNARFNVALVRTPLSTAGIDEISFLLDANKSGQFQTLQKAASGGEMSRIMLCIKSLTARALHMPTLIFDEVDTGISGEAARQVGALLRELASYHQVICITHQPQVAARGTKHFYVYKQADATGKFTTQVKTLDEPERVLAIARMIGGEQPSEAAINNAKELVNSAQPATLRS